MRNSETMLDLKDVSILCQYLYADEKNTITFNNGLTDLKIRMTENCSVMCKNLKFPEIPETNWTETFNIPNILGIIDVLKSQKPEIYKNQFENRWEEIKTLTAMAMPYKEPKKR